MIHATPSRTANSAYLLGEIEGLPGFTVGTAPFVHAGRSLSTSRHKLGNVL